MVKKIALIVVFVIITLSCALWSPWQYWNFSLAELVGVEKPRDFARLQVSSLSGEVEIFVDDESRGTVGPEGSPFLIEDVEPGKRLIRLERLSEQEGAYISFERLIEFYTGTDVVVAYELGPNKEFSEGNLISAFKNVVNGETTKLNVYTEPEKVRVNLDGQYIGETPIEGVDLDLNSTHKLKLEKTGYESQELSMLPEDEELRSNLKGFDMNVEANLFLIPIRTE